MISVSEIYKNEETSRSFIASCELSFVRGVNKAASHIGASEKTKVVALSGPTCSGKTTTASIITARLEASGRRARVLSIDDFYFSREEMEKRKITDFEGVDAIDLELLSDTVNRLIHGEKALIPTFDFKQRRRVAMTEYTPDNNDIYIFEGIQAMYPEVLSLLDGAGYTTVFINVASELDVCGNIFDRYELRFLRRVVRDWFYRGTSPETTLSLWKNVRRNEDENIFPYAQKAEYVINSLLPYEIFIIGKYFLDITGKFRPGYSGVEGAEIIMSLRSRLLRISDNCLTADMVPHESVFREFIA